MAFALKSRPTDSCHPDCGFLWSSSVCKLFICPAALSFPVLRRSSLTLRFIFQPSHHPGPGGERPHSPVRRRWPEVGQQGPFDGFATGWKSCALFSGRLAQAACHPGSPGAVGAISLPWVRVSEAKQRPELSKRQSQSPVCTLGQAGPVMWAGSSWEPPVRWDFITCNRSCNQERLPGLGWSLDQSAWASQASQCTSLPDRGVGRSHEITLRPPHGEFPTHQVQLMTQALSVQNLTDANSVDYRWKPLFCISLVTDEIQTFLNVFMEIYFVSCEFSVFHCYFLAHFLSTA